MGFFRKPFVYAGLFTLCLLAFTAYALLDVFVIPHPLSAVSPDASQKETGETAASPAESGETSEGNPTAAAVITEDSYTDGAVSITMQTRRVENTTVYLADIRLQSAASLKTALAHSTFGTNVTQKVSAMAAANQAILAVNGDYYGANSRGYVIKNGVLYRDTVRADSENGDLVIYADGTCGIIREAEVTAQELLDSGVVQLFAFGPVLVQNGEVAVTEGEEVGKAMSSNPRTAIGFIDPLHIVLAVSDGRTADSVGLTLADLARVMQEAGCATAYNLDGGGSSTLYFNGRVLNNPTTNGRTISERAVSDTVYIGRA